MKDAYYFSHDSNSQDDPKCMLLIDQLGMEGYGIFWGLIEKLRNESNYKLPLMVCKIFAKRWGTSEEKVLTVVKQFGLFIVEGDSFFSLRLLNSMELKSKKAKDSVSHRWNKNKLLENDTNVIRPYNDCNTNDIRIDTIKGKESKGKESKEKEILIYAQSEINSLNAETATSFKFILNNGNYAVITNQLYEKLHSLYSGVNLDIELKKIEAWCEFNSTRRKTEKGVMKFINSWLSRTQDNQGSKINFNNGYKNGTSTSRQLPTEWEPVL